MHGGQLSRQWRKVRAIEASPNGLNLPEIFKWKETSIPTTDPDPGVPQAAGFLMDTEILERAKRWAFREPFKIKISQKTTRILSFRISKDLSGCETLSPEPGDEEVFLRSDLG